jgi:photosystem II stability/assembly factor-like uncharacterized protein
MTNHVLALACDRESAALYAARTSGLFVSHDVGGSWVALFDASAVLAGQMATAISVSGAQILAGIPGGVARSVDAGRSWVISQFTRPAPAISALVMHESGTCLAGTLEDGLFASHDGGQTWQPRNYGLTDPCVLSLAQTDDGIYLAGTASGLYVSRNDGNSWSRASFPVRSASIAGLAISRDGSWLCAAEDAGLWVCDPASENWSHLTPEGVPVGLVAASSGIIAAATDEGLLVSHDGTSWAFSADLPVGSPSALCMVDDHICAALGNIIYTGALAGSGAHPER